MNSSKSARTISFSGVDGAGKSTQIEALRRYLENQGLRVRVLRFWDDVAALTRLREEAGHKVFKGEKGIGTPEAPVNRRDKNVRAWPMTCLRLGLYFLDALSLRSIFRKAVRSNADIIIFDRYTYDELANLDMNHRLMRAYANFLIRIVPRPDISFVLDADPVVARARKPEYPLDFLHFNRQAYLRLSQFFDLTLIPPADIAEAQCRILDHTCRILTSVNRSGQTGPNHLQEAPAHSASSRRPAVF